MSNIQDILRSDFHSLLPGAEVEIDAQYIIITDVVTQQDDIYEYRFVAHQPEKLPQVFIKSSDLPFEPYDTFWSRRLNFGRINERTRVRTSEKLGSTNVVAAKLTSRAFDEPIGRPIENLHSLLDDSSTRDPLSLFFLTADGGRGKSTILQKFVLEEIRTKSKTLNILIDIHGKSFASISEHIAFELDKVAPWIAYDGLLRLVGYGMIRLVVDGFDELGVELGEEVAFERLQSFIDECLDVRNSLSSSILLERGIQFVLAGRTQYFGNAGLRQRISRIEKSCNWIEFEPWEPESAVIFVRENPKQTRPDATYLEALRTGLETIQKQQPELYSLAVHPIVLRVLAEALIPVSAVTTSSANSKQPVRGLVELLDRGIQSLLIREESKHVSASGASILPVDIQLKILDLVCSEIIKHNEDPLAFDPFYVEWAATTVAQQANLEPDAVRRLAGAAPQHVLFGFGAQVRSKMLGFLHPMVFDVVAGWIIAEKLEGSSGTSYQGISNILQARHLSDEMLASAAIRIEKAPVRLSKLADITQDYLSAAGDPTVSWNLSKLCFDRKLSSGQAATPSSGSWKIRNTSFVQIPFNGKTLANSEFTKVEFTLCELEFPNTAPVTFDNCTWNQSTFFIATDAQAKINRNCRVSAVIPIVHGREIPIIAGLDELEDTCKPFSQITFTASAMTVQPRTDIQKTLARVARELVKAGNFRVSTVREVIQIEEGLVFRFVERLRQMGFVREKRIPKRGKEPVYQVRGDLMSGADELFNRGEF